MGDKDTTTRNEAVETLADDALEQIHGGSTPKTAPATDKPYEIAQPRGFTADSFSFGVERELKSWKMQGGGIE